MTDHDAASRIAWIERYPDNGLVTDWYIHSVGDVIADLGFTVEYVDDCARVGNRKRDLYFVSVAKSASVLVLKGCTHLIYWAQGLAPEEDYLRFNSRLRRFAFEVCEKIALSKASRIFMVSDAMCRHFECKYGFVLKEKTFIAPCCNESMHPESFFTDGKYEHPVFTYTGGLSKYQCIDKMLDLFSDIKTRIPNAELLFYTWDVDRANELVLAHGLKGVTVESKRQDELPGALSRAKYGFVIRDDIAVNRVATPTKISTYMANGIIPLVSSCVEGFSDASHSLEHVICCDNDDMAAAVLKMEERLMIPQEMYAEYRSFFDDYFDLGKKGDAMRAFLLPVAESVER